MRSQIVNLTIRLSPFRLPPVEEALVVGKRAAVGPVAMLRALEEMSPGQFELVPVEDTRAEALIIRRCELRRVPREELVRTILRHASPILGEGDTLHISLGIEIRIREDLRLQA